ncbi:MAG: restriction endonuclease subunit S [Prochloraceae cyanobacterium]|nr:restriction endonuclease subunit S [Prochloraceae cyanobacterium]
MSKQLYEKKQLSLNYLPLKTITTKIGSGATPRGGKESYKKYGISLIRSMNVYDFEFNYKDLAYIDEEQARRLKNVEVKEKDILLNITGASVARCTLVPKNILPARVNQHVSIIRINQQIAVPYYVLYTINSSAFKDALLNISMTGATREALTKDDICRFKIPLPPLETQNKIAAILSAYDDLVENNKRRIALLENMAEEIYREWFVRFRFPGYQQAKFEKGIPVGWEVKKLDALANITSSKRIFLSDYVNEGVPFYRSKEIIELYRGLEPSSQLYISEEKFTEIEARFGSPKENDILITSVGTLGIPYLVKNKDRFYFKDGNLIWFRSRNCLISKFLYFWIQTDQGKGALLETTIGSSQQAFTIANLKRVKLLIPHKHLLEKFIDIYNPIEKQTQNLKNQIKKLNSTKQSLLGRLISGKLSVENLDIQFPPSML